MCRIYKYFMVMSCFASSSGCSTGGGGVWFRPLKSSRLPPVKSFWIFWSVTSFLTEHWRFPTMGTAPWGEMDLEVKDVNGSSCLSRNESDRGLSASSSGVSTALASVLIFTIVVDILGNVLVILSVYRNKKLRNAGERSRKRWSVDLSRLKIQAEGKTW